MPTNKNTQKKRMQEREKASKQRKNSIYVACTRNKYCDKKNCTYREKYEIYILFPRSKHIHRTQQGAHGEKVREIANANFI